MNEFIRVCVLWACSHTLLASCCQETPCRSSNNIHFLKASRLQYTEKREKQSFYFLEAFPLGNKCLHFAMNEINALCYSCYRIDDDPQSKRGWWAFQMWKWHQSIMMRVPFTIFWVLENLHKAFAALWCGMFCRLCRISAQCWYFPCFVGFLEVQSFKYFHCVLSVTHISHTQFGSFVNELPKRFLTPCPKSHHRYF